MLRAKKSKVAITTTSGGAASRRAAPPMVATKGLVKKKKKKGVVSKKKKEPPAAAAPTTTTTRLTTLTSYDDFVKSIAVPKKPQEHGDDADDPSLPGSPTFEDGSPTFDDDGSDFDVDNLLSSGPLSPHFAKGLHFTVMSPVGDDGNESPFLFGKKQKEHARGKSASLVDRRLSASPLHHQEAGVSPASGASNGNFEITPATTPLAKHRGLLEDDSDSDDMEWLDSTDNKDDEFSLVDTTPLFTQRKSLQQHPSPPTMVSKLPSGRLGKIARPQQLSRSQELLESTDSLSPDVEAQIKRMEHFGVTEERLFDAPSDDDDDLNDVLALAAVADDAPKFFVPASRRSSTMSNSKE